MVIREIPVADTRPLRHRILRPHESVEYLISHEPSDAFALGAFDGGERLVAVGFVGRDGEPSAWRVRGMATEPMRGAAEQEVRSSPRCSTTLAQAEPPAVWCNARLLARSLYERAGFTVVSEEFDLGQIGPHLVMEWRPGRDQATSTTDA